MPIQRKKKYGQYIRPALIGAFFLLLFSPVFPALYRDWIYTGDYFHSDNSHGILVPFITLFLIWRAREKVQWKDVQPSTAGLTVFIISLIFYLVSYTGGIYLIQRFAMLAALIGLIWYNLGEKVLKPFLFPLLFLFFMVPIPYSLQSLVSLPLQSMVTAISGFMIRDIFSLPVFREGNMLYFSSTSLEVAEACSGIRSLMTFLMLGSLFAYMSRGTIKSKAIFLVMAVPLALFTNLLRVTGTGILANYFGRKVAKGFLHEFSGFAVLGFGLILMVGLWKLLVSLETKSLKSSEEA